MLKTPLYSLEVLKSPPRVAAFARGGKDDTASDAGSEQSEKSVKGGAAAKAGSNYCCPESRYSPRFWVRNVSCSNANPNPDP